MLLLSFQHSTGVWTQYWIVKYYPTFSAVCPKFSTQSSAEWRSARICSRKWYRDILYKVSWLKIALSMPLTTPRSFTRLIACNCSVIRRTTDVQYMSSKIDFSLNSAGLKPEDSRLLKERQMKTHEQPIIMAIKEASISSPSTPVTDLFTS